MKLSARITAWRLHCGFSQSELARLIGVSAAAVNHWEQGLAQPTHDNVALMAQALGVSLAEFWGAVPAQGAA